MGLTNDAPLASRLQFGPFEVDLKTRRLRKFGVPLKLQEQPFRLLTMLLETPGELVERELLQKRLWPDGTFVDFEQGLNKAAHKLRIALGDTAAEAKYIETVARRGYCFIGTVVAVPDEQVERKAAIPTRSAIPQKQHPGWHRWFSGLRKLPAAVLVLACLALIAGMLLHTSSGRAPILRPRDWLLVAAFENRTGEKSLSGMAELAIEAALRDSTYINVVPTQRLKNSLRRLKQASDGPITADLGRQIAKVDGQIRAIMTGDLDKEGGKYTLHATVLEPDSGQVMARFSDGFTSPPDLLLAAYRLSNKVRRQLGEAASRGNADSSFADSQATRSLEALRASTHTEIMMSQSNWKAAEILAREAIRQDPDYALPYLQLAFSMAEQGKPRSEWASFGHTGGRLSERLPARDRLYNLGAKSILFGDSAGAITFLQALVALYPDDAKARNLLIGALTTGMRALEAAEHAVELARLNFNDFAANADAARRSFHTLHNTAAAEQYVMRARALPGADETETGELSVWVEWFEVNRCWLLDDAACVMQQLDAIRHRRAVNPAFLLTALGSSYLAIGRLRDAESVFREMRTRELMSYHTRMAQLAYARRDPKLVAREVGEYCKVLGKGPLYMGMMPALWFLRTNSVTEPAQMIHNFVVTAHPEPWLSFVKGEVQLSSGQCSAAAATLRGAMDNLRHAALPQHSAAAEALAAAYQCQGRPPRDIIPVLEEAGTERWLVNLIYEAEFWLQGQTLLYRNYLQTGRKADADRVRHTLLKILSQADPDYPLLAELKSAS